MHHLAQNLIIQPQISVTGNSPTPRPVSITGPLVGITKLTDVIQILTNFLYPLAAIILLFVLIWGGIDFLTSRGEAEKVNGAKQKITAGIIGFILLLLSYVITQVLGFIFDVGNGLF